MKIKILFGIIIMISCSVYSQNYIRMVDSTYRWDVLCGGLSTNGDSLMQTDKLSFIDDTIINSKNYAKLFSSTHYSPIDSSLNYICAMREDTLQQKIFKWDYNAEVLMYDFSLTTGDSVIWTYDFAGHPYYLKVDSVTIINFAGKLRRKFFLKEWQYLIPFNLYYTIYYRWIEGIGKIDAQGKIIGPEQNLQPFANELLCFWQSGQMLYQNSTYATCLIAPLSTDEKYDFNEISIYPNPCHSNINLVFNQGMNNGVLEIFNVLGERIYSDEVKNSSQKEIDLISKPDGIYFLKAQFKEGLFYKKIIKQ